MDPEISKSMGLPEAWDGDSKAIGKFLRFVHGHLTQIGCGVREGEMVMVIGSLTSECEQAMRFAEGYAAAVRERPVTIGGLRKRGEWTTAL